MAEFRKKPVVIKASQWFKMGDHLTGSSYIGAENYRSRVDIRHYETSPPEAERRYRRAGGAE